MMPVRVQCAPQSSKAWAGRAFGSGRLGHGRQDRRKRVAGSGGVRAYAGMCQSAGSADIMTPNLQKWAELEGRQDKSLPPLSRVCGVLGVRGEPERGRTGGFSGVAEFRSPAGSRALGTASSGAGPPRSRNLSGWPDIQASCS